MSNRLFIDTMDKVNAFAKQVGFTNGIAWARAQKENNRLNSYDYEIFSGCHDLRNLMAHGFAKDINISSETLQKAQLFFRAISTPYTVNGGQSIVFNNVKSYNELEIQLGDYVLARKREGSRYEIFRVVGTSSRSIELRDLSNNYVSSICTYDYDFLNHGFFVVRDNSFDPNWRRGHYGEYVDAEISTSNGCTITFRYLDYGDGSSNKKTFNGYFAHKHCLYKECGILLMGPGENKEAYMKNCRKKLIEEFNKEKDIDLPF